MQQSHTGSFNGSANVNRRTMKWYDPAADKSVSPPWPTASSPVRVTSPKELEAKARLEKWFGHAKAGEVDQLKAMHAAHPSLLNALDFANQTALDVAQTAQFDAPNATERVNVNGLAATLRYLKDKKAQSGSQVLAARRAAPRA